MSATRTRNETPKSTRRSSHRRQRNRQPREVNLRHEPFRTDHAVGGRADSSLKKIPRHQTRQDEHRIRELPGRPRDNDHKHGHRQHGLNDGPQHAQHRLLVANANVPQRKLPDQIAALPKLGQIERGPAGLWRDVCFRQRKRGGRIQPQVGLAGRSRDCVGHRSSGRKYRRRSLGIARCARLFWHESTFTRRVRVAVLQ